MPDLTPYASDTTRWEALQKGDGRAFEQLYRLHVGSLLTYGKRLTANPDQVADAVQDVFEEIWNRRATLWMVLPTARGNQLDRCLKSGFVGHLNDRRVLCQRRYRPQ